jgi:hypothetical protein
MPIRIAEVTIKYQLFINKRGQKVIITRVLLEFSLLFPLPSVPFFFFEAITLGLPPSTSKISICPRNKHFDTLGT